MVERLEFAPDFIVYHGHVIDAIRQMPDKSVQNIVTSDPYLGLRDYGKTVWVGGDPNCKHQSPAWADDPGDLERMGAGGQLNANAAKWLKRTGGVCPQCGARRENSMAVDWPEVTYKPYPGAQPITVPAWRGCYGLEPTVDMYVGHSVLIRRELWRVLRDDGIHWLNLGDSYNGSGGAGGDYNEGGLKEGQPKFDGRRIDGYKPQDLMLVPERVAMALQADGWWVRSKPPWLKDNAMPESATTRPAVAHETIYLLTKSGEPLYWCHRDGRGTRKQPKPDYRWVDLSAQEYTETDQEPPNWRTETFLDPETGRKRKRWQRINLWEGHKYYYDIDAIRKPATPQSLSALSFARSGKHSAHVLPGQSAPQYRPDREKRHLPGAEQDGLGKGFQMPEKWNHSAGRNRRTTDWWNDSLDLLIEQYESYAAHLRHIREHGGLLLDPDGYPAGFHINPAAFKEAHFATFPPGLVEPCILAGSSPQACPQCGAPWQRVTEKDRVPDRPNRVQGRQGDSIHLAHGKDGRAGNRATSAVDTTGWQPTCECEGNDGSGLSWNFDPFAGSLTALMVALQHGRGAVGAELNREYIDLGLRARMNGAQTSLLGQL